MDYLNFNDEALKDLIKVMVNNPASYASRSASQFLLREIIAEKRRKKIKKIYEF